MSSPNLNYGGYFCGGQPKFGDRRTDKYGEIAAYSHETFARHSQNMTVGLGAQLRSWFARSRFLI